MMKQAFFVVALLLALPTHALELSGVYKQGGFVFGKTEPGAKVMVGALAVPVDEKGRFVAGFGRKAAAEVVIKSTVADGTTLQKSMIIEPREYKVQHIKGVKKKHVNPRAPEDLARIKSDTKEIKRARATYAPLEHFDQKFVMPTEGVITGVFGSSRTFNGEERSWHKGLDIANKTGTPIIAPADGVVRLALADSFFNGNLVILDHGHQFMTIYAHMHTMDVKENDVVKQGDSLGTVGSTGRSTGPHLHWGLYWRNMALDPKLLIE